MQITLYGIPNCDTVKKARTWLAGNGIDFRFHDFRKDGLESGIVQGWLEQVDWQTLVNRKGMTWRNLDDARKTSATDTRSALALMLEYPAVIKRPVLQYAGGTVVGFSEAHYRQIFKEQDQ